MAVSRREALVLGAAVPVSGLFLASARGQVPQQQNPAGQGYGEDPILACCLLIDGRKQIEICRWAKEKARNDEVKAFAQAEIDEHEKFKADLRRFGFEYPAPPQFGNQFQQGGQVPQASQTRGQSAAGETTTAAGGVQLAGTQQQAGPRMLAVGRLLLPPGLVEIVSLSHEVADQCIANAKSALDKKAGEGKFDKAFVGMQLHEHYGLLDKCQVFEKHSTDRLREVLVQGRPVIERHIATLESLCQKLEKGGDTGRRDADRGNTTRPDTPDRH